MSFEHVLIGKDIMIIPSMVYGALWFSKHFHTHCLWYPYEVDEAELIISLLKMM